MVTGKQDIKWMAKYNALKEYILKYHHLPDKKKVENRGLLNWWKYNKRRAKSGLLDEKKVVLLEDINLMRDEQQLHFL